MKKLVMVMLVMILSLLALPNNYKKIKAAEKIESVDINVIRDNLTVRIEHLTKYKFVNAIVERSYTKEKIKYSELLELKVNNDKFELPDNTLAFKVHQLKYQQGNLIYRVSAKKNNTIGDFTGVQRVGFTEIEIVKAKKISYGGTPGHIGVSAMIFEFYFNFDKEHDEIISINVDYILRQRNKFLFWTWKEEKINEWVNKDEKYKIPHSNEFLKALEKNNNKEIASNYVTRIAPTNQMDSAELKNFAIIKIEYKVDGEFFIDDVVHDPISVWDDDVEWLHHFVENLKKIINNFIDFFTSNGNIIFKIALVIIILIIVSLLMSLIKIPISIIKLIFSIPGKIIKLFKILFVPKKKYKKIRRY